MADNQNWNKAFAEVFENMFGDVMRKTAHIGTTQQAPAKASTQARAKASTQTQAKAETPKGQRPVLDFAQAFEQAFGPVMRATERMQ